MTGEGEGGAIASRTTRNGKGGAIASRAACEGEGEAGRTTARVGVRASTGSKGYDVPVGPFCDGIFSVTAGSTPVCDGRRLE